MVNDATPKVSIIIPTKDRSSDVNLCVESILNSDYQNIEVIVVDNGSEDNTVDKLKKNILDTRLKIFPVGRNLGAGGGRNYGASKADGEYYLFIDDDNEIKPTLVGFLVDSFENRTDCCQIGPLMFYKGTSDLMV